MKRLIHITATMSYAIFSDGTHAQVSLMDMTKNGIQVKAGELMMVENDGRISESITKENFKVKYGLSTMRLGT